MRLAGLGAERLKQMRPGLAAGPRRTPALSEPTARYAPPPPTYAERGQTPTGTYELFRPEVPQSVSRAQIHAEIQHLARPNPRPARPRRMGPSDRLRYWLMGKSTPRAYEPTPGEALSSTVLIAFAAMLFGLFAQMTVVGTLQHNRDQQIAYDDLRLSMAEGTTPVGPVEGAAIAKGTPLARLVIPSIGVKEIVLEGTTSGVLRSGVGHRRDTVYPGQVGTSVLMGRRMTYGGPFSKLGSLSVGDDISVQTGQGSATYRVVALREPGDNTPPVTSARLTLVTTLGSRFAPSDVLRVDADLVGTAFAAGVPAFNAARLPRSEFELNGDPDAMGGVVGWGVLLCAAAVGVQWLRLKWGRWQAWLIAVPTLGLFGVKVADHVAQLLPNLL